jgi:uncharacterized protein (TIGR03083 family)
MEISAWHDALTRDCAAVAATAETASLGVPVPACPGWTLADVVYHTGEVLSFWTTIVRDEVDDPETIERPSRPADAALTGWLRQQAVEASRVLRSSDPASRCWTWTEQHDVAFVIRRLAQEIAVHRWDAEDAAGRAASIEPALASDGIDEFLEHFIPWKRFDAEELGGTAHLHCTDVAGEWLVAPGADGKLVVTREHAKGSCALRGAASDLLLVLWRRRPLASVEVIGDAGVARRLVDWTNLN